MMLKSSVGIWLVCLVSCLALSSFSNEPGGDTFDIHLNGKLLLHQQVWKQTSVPDISLDAKSKEDVLSVSYNHCGLQGKNRTVSIRDEQQKVLKVWQFADADQPMKCPVKDFADLNRKGGKLQLFYASVELPEGRVLASISWTADARLTQK